MYKSFSRISNGMGNVSRIAQNGKQAIGNSLLIACPDFVSNTG